MQRVKLQTKTKRGAGRPKAVIDWDKVGKMLEAGCSAVGIAATIGIEEDTLRKRCPGDNKCTFSEFSQQKKAKGDELLRTTQFRTAIGFKEADNGQYHPPNVTMQIWLGKQRLGQLETAKIHLGGGLDLNIQADIDKIYGDGSQQSGDEQSNSDG